MTTLEFNLRAKENALKQPVKFLHPKTYMTEGMYSYNHSKNTLTMLGVDYHEAVYPIAGDPFAAPDIWGIGKDAGGYYFVQVA